MKRKSILTLFALACIGNMTACSFQFTTKLPEKALSNTTFNVNIQQNTSLSEIAEEIDFHDTDSLASGASRITDWATNLVKESSILEEFQAAKLLRVIDGDTLLVEIENKEVRVRLIGINTPESVASQEYLDKTGKENTAAGKEASTFTEEILSEIDIIYLQKDVSETDKYGRLLRYVWIELPQDYSDYEEIEVKMLNGILLDAKIAEVATYEPDTMYEEEFTWIYEN